MTVRHYCALVTVLLFVGFPVVSRVLLKPSGSAPEDRVLGQFTAEQIVARSITVTEHLAPEEKAGAFQWVTLPMTTYGPGPERVRLWKADGDHPSGGTSRAAVSLSFDADTGALLQFSHSTGTFDGTAPIDPMTRGETIRRAWVWLRAFEEIDSGAERKGASSTWQIVRAPSSEAYARTVMFRSGSRTVQITIDPGSGALLLLSCRKSDEGSQR